MVFVPIIILFLGVNDLGVPLYDFRTGACHDGLTAADFIHVAGGFLLLNAEFLAALQIMVYAGAILVLYLFMIMLLDVKALAAQRQRHGSASLTPLLAGMMGALILWVLGPADFGGQHGTATVAVVAAAGNVESVAMGLFTTYLLPFEVGSLILLVAMVGAILLAKKRL